MYIKCNVEDYTRIVDTSTFESFTIGDRSKEGIYKLDMWLRNREYYTLAMDHDREGLENLALTLLKINKMGDHTLADITEDLKVKLDTL